MKRFIISFLVITLFSCNVFSRKRHPFEEVSSTFNREMKRKYQLEYNYSEIYFDKKKICNLQLSFDSYHKITIPEARELLLKVANDYLSTVNSCEALALEFIPYPFKIENLAISIFFVDKNSKKYSSPPLIACVRLIDGEVRYLVNTKPSFPFEEALVESYNLAKKNNEKAQRKGA